MPTEEPWRQPTEVPLRKQKRDWLTPVSAVVVAALLIGLFVLTEQMPGNSSQQALPVAHADAVSQYRQCTGEMLDGLQVVHDYRPAVTPLVQSAVTGAYGVGGELDYARLRQDIARVYPKGGDDTGPLMALVLCQQKFLLAQQLVKDQITRFEQWRNDLWFNWLDFQTDDLRVETPTGMLHGQPALDYMKRPIGKTA